MKYGIRGNQLLWFKSYLENRRQYVKDLRFHPRATIIFAVHK